MCRRWELGFSERSVVTDVPSLSSVSIFTTSVPLVYPMCGHNSLVHIKANTAASPPQKSPESYSDCSTEDRSVVFQHLVAMVTGMIWSSADDSHCGFQKGFIYILFNVSAVSPNHVEWNCRVVAKELVDRDLEGSDGGLIWGTVWALASRNWGRQMKTELG
jgi:hypothetical protein